MKTNCKLYCARDASITVSCSTSLSAPIGESHEIQDSTFQKQREAFHAIPKPPRPHDNGETCTRRASATELPSFHLILKVAGAAESFPSLPNLCGCSEGSSKRHFGISPDAPAGRLKWAPRFASLSQAPRLGIRICEVLSRGSSSCYMGCPAGSLLLHGPGDVLLETRAGIKYAHSIEG